MQIILPEHMRIRLLPIPSHHCGASLPARHIIPESAIDRMCLWRAYALIAGDRRVESNVGKHDGSLNLEQARISGRGAIGCMRSAVCECRALRAGWHT